MIRRRASLSALALWASLLASTFAGCGGTSLNRDGTGGTSSGGDSASGRGGNASGRGGSVSGRGGSTGGGGTTGGGGSSIGGTSCGGDCGEVFGPALAWGECSTPGEVIQGVPSPDAPAVRGGICPKAADEQVCVCAAEVWHCRCWRCDEPIPFVDGDPVVECPCDGGECTLVGGAGGSAGQAGHGGDGAATGGAGEGGAGNTAGQGGAP